MIKQLLFLMPTPALGRLRTFVGKRMCKKNQFFLTLVLVCAPLSHGHAYILETFNFPGASNTQIHDINSSSQLVGTYWLDDPNDRYGFFYDGADFFTIQASDYVSTNTGNATITYAYGLNENGQIAGRYLANEGTRGYLLDGGVFTKLDYPGALHSVARDVDDSGNVLGWYSTPLEGGFLYNNGAYQPLAPKLPSYTPTGFNNSHSLIGVFESSLESFVLRGDELQQVYVDGSDFTSLTGINDFDLITGEYNDGSWHTFVFDGLDFTELEVPGARFTQIQGLSNSGILVGSYGVGDVISGLIARPEPGDPTRSVFYEPISEPPVALLFFAALLSFEYFRRRQNLVDRDRKWS